MGYIYVQRSILSSVIFVLSVFCMSVFLIIPLAQSQEQKSVVGQLDQLKEQNRVLLKVLRATINPWEKAADNLRELVDQFDSSKYHNLALDLGYEYSIQKNGGWRRLTFSTWNGG